MNSNENKEEGESGLMTREGHPMMYGRFDPAGAKIPVETGGNHKMRRLRLLTFSVVLAAFGCGPNLPPADVVIRNGTIYTAYDPLPIVEAVAVTDGRIVFVGSLAEASEYVGPETRVIDLDGTTAVPGLIDSHYHLSGVGNRERTLNLEGTSDLTDFLERVREAVALRGSGEWVTGRGWIEAQWPEPIFPTREDLDEVAPDNPVYLTRADGHAGVANSQAIRLAGAYAWRDVLDTGVIIAGGSDAPVERGDPRIEFYAAVARKDLQGYQAEGWHPEQAVTPEEALKMFTIWGARAAFEEDVKGTLEPGKLADLTVFSKNIMAVPENEILEAETVMTIVGGEIVYERQ